MAADFSVVAIIAAYNEADIIGQVVRALIEQGVGVYVLDDGSTDGTVAAVEPFVGNGVIGIERRMLAGTPAGAPAVFEWARILHRKAQLASELAADWFIHHDADEFRESPWAHLSLRDAVRQVDALGYNAIDFASLDFWPDHDRFRPGDDVREAFTRHGAQKSYDRVQIRCWKKAADVDLASTGGHEARFAERRVFPVRFILRHYPIRGQAHGERKVFRERQRRFLEQERAQGWHVQYDQLREGASFVRDPETLTPYDADAVRVALTLRHRGVEDLEAALGSSQALADARGHEIVRLRDELARACADLGARTAALGERWADIARMNDELVAKHAEAAALRNDLGQQRKMLGDARAELAARNDEAAGLRTELTAVSAAAESRSRALAALNAQLVAASAALDSTRASLHGRDQELGARVAEVGHLNAGLAASRDEAQGLRRALDLQAAEIDRWRSAIADRDRRLDDVHRSWSWRLTSPLRALVGTFARRRRRG
jgi:glycosyl transferase family 2